MERHQAGEAHVIPILLRSVDWTGAPFSQIPVLPKNKQPVTTWDNRDEAFQEIAEEIRGVAIGLRWAQGRRVERKGAIAPFLQAKIRSFLSHSTDEHHSFR
jgi:hypothetical protein